MQNLVTISGIAVVAGSFLLGMAAGEMAAERNQYCRRIRINGSWLESRLFAGIGFLAVGLVVRYFVLGNRVS